RSKRDWSSDVCSSDVLLIIQFETMAIGSQHFSVKAKLDDYSQEFVEYVGFDYIDQDLLDKDIAFGERLYVILRPNEDGIAEIDEIGRASCREVGTEAR